jgi:hypothetical protein
MMLKPSSSEPVSLLHLSISPGAPQAVIVVLAWSSIWSASKELALDARDQERYRAWTSSTGMRIWMMMGWRQRWHSYSAMWRSSVFLVML